MTKWLPIPESLKKTIIKEAVAEARLGGVTGDAFLRALCDSLLKRHAKYKLGAGVHKTVKSIKLS